MEVNGCQQHSSKYHLLCSTEEPYKGLERHDGELTTVCSFLGELVVFQFIIITLLNKHNYLYFLSINGHYEPNEYEPNEQRVRYKISKHRYKRLYIALIICMHWTLAARCIDVSMFKDANMYFHMSQYNVTTITTHLVTRHLQTKTVEIVWWRWILVQMMLNKSSARAHLKCAFAICCEWLRSLFLLEMRCADFWILLWTDTSETGLPWKRFHGPWWCVCHESA